MPVNGQHGITCDTALRLRKAFKTIPEFWMNLQAQYKLEIARDNAQDELKRIHQYAA